MNAITYIRNVGKSFGYIAVDVIKDYNPAVAAFAESAKDLGSELYQTVSDFKTNITSKVSEMNLKEEAKSVATEVRSNLFDDLKTGKWYNNDRISRAALAEFEEGFGDFSFGDDDFGDFEFEDDDVDNSTRAEMAQDQINTRALINSMDVVGAKSANAINTATVRSAEYVVASQRESSRALYSLTSRGFGEVTKGLSAISSGISAIAAIAEPINIHIQNSTNFYTRSTEYQEKSLALLEQIAKNTSASHPAANKSSRQKNTVGDFMMDGAIDLMSYYEMVSNNVKDMVGLYGSFLGGGMGGSIKNSKFVKSPISTLLKAGVKGLTPKIMKKSMEEFNEYLEGFFATMLGSIRDKNVSNPILAMLKDFLVPKSGYKKDIDSGAYNKGKVDWDGMSRKALMEVIPFQLSQIVSVLTGKPQEIYDYKTGKWIKANTVQKDFDDMKNRYSDAAGYEFVSEVKAVLKELKNQNKLTDEQLARMSGQIDTFNRTAYHSDNSDFIHFAEDGFDFSRYGLDRSTWNVLRAYAKDLKRNGRRSRISRYTGQIMTDRARMGNNLLELEADGSSIYNILHNGATLVDETERGRNLLGVDEYNNDIFYYLQGIYQSTTHLSDNLHLFIPNGRSTRGTRIERNARITPIRSITRRDRVNTNTVEEHRENAVDLNNLDADQLEEMIANMSDQTRSGRRLPPRSNARLREYAMNKYNSTDGNYERDEALERQLEAWESSEQAMSGIRNRLRESGIGRTILNFSESILNLLRTPTEAVSSLLSAAEVSMDRLLTGNREEGEKGILDLAKEGFEGLFGSLNEKLNNIFPIDKFKGFMDKIFGAKGEDGQRHGSSLSGFANATSEELGGAGRWFRGLFTGNNDGPVDQAYNGRRVTRTGIVAVSEGELIIPSELNPFYKGKTNKKRQKSREREAIGRFFGAYNEGTTAVGTDDEEPLSEDGTGRTLRISENSILGFLLNSLRDGGRTLAHGAGEVFENIVPNREQAQREKSKISDVIQTALKEMGASKGAAGAGALIGGGVSLLTGGLISPILGAGLGAATGIVIKSKAVQDALFGSEDENGNFKEGFFKKETAEFIKKHVPDIGKGAAIGGATGLFMGSPVMGAILGSTVGYIKSSETARKYLFGGGSFGDTEAEDSGIMSKELQAKIKKAVPSMSAGAILGLAAGPFGSLAANLVLGSALGFAADTDKFKNWMFGQKDEHGNKTKSGFIDLLKDKFINPLVEIFAQVGENIKHTVRNTFHNLGKSMRKLFTNFIKGGIGQRVVHGAKAVGRGLNKITGGLFNKIGDGVVGVRNHGRRRALRRGYNVFDASLGRNLNAQERRELRRSDAMQHGRGAGEDRFYDRYDEFLANANVQDINEVDATLQSLIDPTREFDNQIRRSRSSARRILENSRDALINDSSLSREAKRDLKKSFDKVYKFISDGKFDEAREWTSRLRMNEDTRRALLREIDKSEEAFRNRDIATNDSAAGRRALLGDSRFSGVRHLLGDHISDADLMNLRDLNRTQLSHLRTPEARLEQAQDATVESRDILRDIRTIMVAGPNGLDPAVRNNIIRNASTSSSTEGETTTREAIENVAESDVLTQDSRGRWRRANGRFASRAEIERYTSRNAVQDAAAEADPTQGDIRTDSDGLRMIYNGREWTHDMSDQHTRETIEERERVTNAITQTAENTGTLHGLSRLLSFMGGNGEDDEEGSNLFDDMENFDLNLKSVIAGLGKFALGLTGFWAVASGKLDGFFNKLGFGGKAGNETIFGSTGKVDQQGNDLIIGEDGKYYNADGTEYSGEVYADTSDYSRATTPFSSKFVFNEARQLLTRGKSFFTELPGIKQVLNKTVGKVFQNRNTNLMIDTLDFLERNGFDINRSNAILDSASSPRGIRGLLTKAKDSVKNTWNAATSGNGIKGLFSNIGDKAKSGFTSLTDKIGGLFNRRTVSEVAEETAQNLLERGSRELVEDAAQQTARVIAGETIEEAAEQATKKQMMEYVQEAVEKLIKNVDNFPFGKKLFKSIPLDKFGKKLVEAIGEKIAKASARAVADCAYAFPPAGVVLDVVFFITDFIAGWNDATEYFKVLKATTWMKLVSALSTSLFGLIPFIGPLIPIGLLVDIIVNVCEACGVDTTELRAEQQSATDEVTEYNRVHNTDLDYSDYSKNVAGNKGWLEKAWDWTKTQTSTNWNIITTSWNKATSGEYGDSFSDIINGIAGTADDNYKSLAWRTAKENMELEMRTEMRNNGGVNEEELQQQLRLRIDNFLCTEEGSVYYKYEYDETKQSYEDFKREFETTVKNSHTSSSGQTHGGSGKRRESSTLTATSTYAQGYNGMPSDIANRIAESNSAGASGLNNFVSQLDSRYANMSMGGINTVQSKGCGPAAAVMALNQYAGNANMNSAVNTASRYQTSGGTDAAFFADYYSKHGINASYYDGTSSAGRSNIINNIRNGIPVVLMGSDIGNRSKANSPFGPNNHYVVASGFDGSGNIIINDPEARRGNKKYSSKILRNVKLGIGMSAAGSRIFRRFGLSGGTTTYSHELRNDATTQMVWTLFRELGYSDAATAGIMGNLQQESSIDPTRYQMNGGPGRGLAQWTVGERHDKLIEYAANMDRDWTDLEAQILFIDHEITGSQKGFFKSNGCPVSDFKNLTDVAYATEIFERAFERAGKPNIPKRVEYATYYYNQFSGKTYDYSTYIPTDYGTSSYTEETTEESSRGILDNIIGLFAGKLDKIFGIKKTSTTTATNSGPEINANPSGIKFSGSTPVEIMKSILKQIRYSMNGPRDPEQGSADCSSTVRWAIKKATGLDIGGNTAAQYDNANLETVWYNNGNIATEVPENIKENDILFFSRPNSDYTAGRKDRVGHIELYAGNNQMIGHGGGGDGYGPTLKDLSLKGKNGGLIKVARLIGVDTNSSSSTTSTSYNKAVTSTTQGYNGMPSDVVNRLAASGSGLVDISRLGKTSRAVYNRGANNVVHFNPNTGEYRVGKLYSGGASGVRRTGNTTVFANTTGGISKDTALLLKTIITLIETLVSNTDDIHNIYEALLQLIDSRNIDADTASKAKAALNTLNERSASTGTGRIEAQLSGLKAQVDSILAS